MGGGDGADDIVFGFLLYLLDKVSLLHGLLSLRGLDAGFEDLWLTYIDVGFYRGRDSICRFRGKVYLQ